VKVVHHLFIPAALEKWVQCSIPVKFPKIHTPQSDQNLYANLWNLALDANKCYRL
jgi:hypothetical protein